VTGNSLKASTALNKKLMKTTLLKAGLGVTLAMLLPQLAHAQGVADDLHSLQGVLRHLFEQMLPLCKGMIAVSRGIAGLATLSYIGARVWRHIALAEPVEIYPLLRPFMIGICIAAFPAVLGLINGILQPIVTATQDMVTSSNQAIERMLSGQPESDAENIPNDPNTDPDKWYQYSHPDGVAEQEKGSSNPISSAFSGWSIKNWARKFISEVLNVLFQAAALCLDTIRTFKMIVLAILGPLCFGLSIFDGFQHTLKQWLARYVNVFMWLPIANIFGAIIAKIQENMIRLQETGQLEGNQFGNSNTGYLIFLLIGIMGYSTVPSIANYIMNVGGHALFSKASSFVSSATSFAGGVISQQFMKSGGGSGGGGSADSSPSANDGRQEKLSGNAKTKDHV
jgi:conjugative transposon TraJ protein